MSEVISVGATAPDFKLKDHKGEVIELSSLRGKKVLLSFHPLAWTSVCADQMKSLEANHSRFGQLSVVPLGISVDSVPCKTAWAKQLGVEKTSLLADFWPHGGVAKSFGLFMEEKGISQRANVLLDEEGKAIFVKVYEIKTLPDVEELFDALEG